MLKVLSRTREREREREREMQHVRGYAVKRQLGAVLLQRWLGRAERPDDESPYSLGVTTNRSSLGLQLSEAAPLRNGDKTF